jgi:tetratricopeptide (TPR) repeat protein
VNRAIVRRELGFSDGALQDFDKALRLDPNRGSAYSGRGQFYLRNEDYRSALADFNRAVELALTPDYVMLRARTFELSGELDRSLADYENLARRDPENISFYTAQASVWRTKGDLNRAIAAYDRAALAKPNVCGPRAMAR